MDNSKRIVLLILTNAIAAASCLLFMLYLGMGGITTFEQLLQSPARLAESERRSRHLWRLWWILLMGSLLLSSMFLSNVMQLWKAYRRTKRLTERRGAR